MQDYFDFDIYRLKKAATGTIVNDANKAGIKFIIILESDNYNAEMIEFLKKVFASISVDLLTDCTILSFNRQDILSFENIFKFGISKHIISFGIDSSYFDVQTFLKKREWNCFENFSIMLFDNLHEIRNNQNLKRKLWEQLKMLK